MSSGPRRSKWPPCPTSIYTLSHGQIRKVRAMLGRAICLGWTHGNVTFVTSPNAWPERDLRTLKLGGNMPIEFDWMTEAVNKVPIGIVMSQIVPLNGSTF